MQQPKPARVRTPVFTREFVEQNLEKAVEILNHSYYDLVELESRIDTAQPGSRSLP